MKTIPLIWHFIKTDVRFLLKSPVGKTLSILLLILVIGTFSNPLLRNPLLGISFEALFYSFGGMYLFILIFFSSINPFQGLNLKPPKTENAFLSTRPISPCVFFVKQIVLFPLLLVPILACALFLSFPPKAAFLLYADYYLLFGFGIGYVGCFKVICDTNRWTLYITILLLLSPLIIIGIGNLIISPINCFLSSGQQLSDLIIRLLIAYAGFFLSLVFYLKRKPLFFQLAPLLLAPVFAFIPETYRLNFFTETIPDSEIKLNITTDGRTLQSVTVHDKDDMVVIDAVLSDEQYRRKPEISSKDQSPLEERWEQRMFNLMRFYKYSMMDIAPLYYVSSDRLALLLAKENIHPSQDFSTIAYSYYNNTSSTPMTKDETIPFYINELSLLPPDNDQSKAETLPQGQYQGEFMIARFTLHKDYEMPIKREISYNKKGVIVAITESGFYQGEDDKAEKFFINIRETTPIIQLSMKCYGIRNSFILLNKKRSEYIALPQNSLFASIMGVLHIVSYGINTITDNPSLTLREWIEDATLVKYSFEETATGVKPFTLIVHEDKSITFVLDDATAKN